MDTEDFEADCRTRFAGFCLLYRTAKYHAAKRQYVELAYGVMDEYAAWLEIQTL